MNNLIDEIVEQVYAQFNEETAPSPEQQGPESPEQKDDKTKASEIPPELIEKIKNLNAKVEQHKGLYTKVSEFLEMMKDGMLGDASAEDLKSFLAEGEAAKSRHLIDKLLKIGKPKHIIEASNIIMKELDRMVSNVIPKAVKRITKNTPEILKHVAGEFKAFEEIYKIASKFPALVKKNLQKSSDAPAAKEKEQEKEKGKAGEPEEPELWDPDKGDIKEFVFAYNTFRERFYQSKKLIQQGMIVGQLRKALQKMSDDEDQEAAIGRDPNKGQPAPEEKPQQQPGQISESFLKWLTATRITNLIVETMDETENEPLDREDYEKQLQDRGDQTIKRSNLDRSKSDFARDKSDNLKLIDKDATEAPPSDEPPKEGEQIPKKELQNIQADVESFYQNAIDLRNELDKAGEMAKKGSSSFKMYKKIFVSKAKEIQKDVLELYNDLISINPPKDQIAEAEEEGQKEISDMNRDERVVMVQKVYDKITDLLSPIAAALRKGEKISYDRMKQPVANALEQLESILEIFPSVKAFKGGSYDEVSQKYSEMMQDLDVLTKLFQRLVKSGNMSSITIRNLYKGLKKFSHGLEEVFNVKSLIKDKPAPEVADKPGEEAEGEVDTDGDRYSDEDEKQAQTDPKDPKDVPSDIDKDGVSDAAEDKAGTDKEDPKSKPEEKGEVDINSPALAKAHIKKIMEYPLFQEYLPKANAQQYNAIMLMYLLSKYKEPVKENEEKKGFPKDPLSTATIKFESFFGFNKDRVNDDLRKLKSLNKPAFDSLLSFFKAVTPAEIRKFVSIMTQRMEKRPFSVSLDPDILMKDSTAPKFADSDEIKKAQSVEAPSKTEKGSGLAQRTSQKASRPQLVPIQELMKMLNPIIEKMLRGING